MREDGGTRRDDHVSGDEPQPVDWAQLYEECHEQVRRYFAHHVKCPHDVEDLVQSVFTSLIVHRVCPRHRRAYLRAVARHQLCSYCRRRGRSIVVERVVSLHGYDRLAEEFCSDWESDPLHQLARQETRRTVTVMMSRLSPALAEVLRLRFVDGLRPREMVQRTGCSRETLKKRLFRARQALAGLYRERASTPVFKTVGGGNAEYAPGGTVGP